MMSGSVEEYLQKLLTREEVEDVLRRGPLKDAMVEAISVSPLMAAGENYGSVMAAVEAHLAGGQVMRMVAKLLPMSPFLRESFDCSITVRKEIAFYELLVPEFFGLQPEMDLFPACEGARVCRGEDSGQPIEESAMILLENLKAHGYETRERLRGLDLPHGELALVGLGRLHALGIAMKLLKPEAFQHIVNHVAAPFYLGPRGEDSLVDMDPVVTFLEDIPDCAPHVGKIRDCLYRMAGADPAPSPREPYRTIVHNDFWTNNMMFLYGDNKEPKNLKVVDFQIALYDSPIKDVLMFLYTSLELGLRENYYDHLLDIYHRSLTSQLALLGVDTADFSLENFQKEMDTMAPHCFLHIFFLLRPIFAERRPEMAKFSIDDFVGSSRLGNLYKARVSQLVTDFVQNGWI